MLAITEWKRTWRLCAPRAQFSDENPETKRCKVTTQRPFWLVRGSVTAQELGVSPSMWLPGPLQYLTHLIMKRNTSGYTLQRSLLRGAQRLCSGQGFLPRHCAI